ncbi:MAG: hypothetical protein EAX86_06625 [Candidatus Heimdallarchaeota archaeon]|nr:hypothetical protein [Candidatus Heimdallarchaeota archaeon]
MVLLLARAPEVLLITRAQIFRVKNLYQRIQRGELGSLEAEQTPIHDYKTQFRSYLPSLPPDLKMELQR